MPVVVFLVYPVIISLLVLLSFNRIFCSPGFTVYLAVLIFDLHEKCESIVMISVRLAHPVSVCGKNFNVVIFSDTINTINVKLCMMVVLIDLYPFTPLSITMIVLQGHSSVKQF